MFKAIDFQHYLHFQTSRWLLDCETRVTSSIFTPLPSATLTKHVQSFQTVAQFCNEPRSILNAIRRALLPFLSQIFINQTLFFELRTTFSPLKNTVLMIIHSFFQRALTRRTRSPVSPTVRFAFPSVNLPTTSKK